MSLDVAVVLDPSLLKIVDPSQGLKPGGLLILNTNKKIDQIRAQFGYKVKLAAVDADLIAHEELGLPIVNTTMLGALAPGHRALSGWTLGLTAESPFREGSREEPESSPPSLQRDDPQ